MGIPKFYRWLSERYPLLNQRLTPTDGPPDVDNLYLDMNGIIHNCTHANQAEVKLTENEMIVRVFDYIDKLIQLVRPKKTLFMAIDGCAPRAKMNQQRSRRFRSAQERLKMLDDLKRKGEPIPDDPFDSNCITPGTPFMERLGRHLRFFIRKKISEDPLWQKPTVIFSGHEVPGEGEHKIMEYIRLEKRKPSYEPNQRHCMYGLDADLIMLSLVTHEPHFCLLREVVSYTGNNRGQPSRETLENPCQESFLIFHIGLLREYLGLEFQDVALPFPLDVERVVDDFVLFCMLVGNDFLPALPTFDINEGALNNLIAEYKVLLPSLGGYLTLAGQVDRRRLECLLAKVGEAEQAVLEERAADAQFMEGKREKRRASEAARTQAMTQQAARFNGSVLAALGEDSEGLEGTSNDEGEASEAEAARPKKAQRGPSMMSQEARELMLSGLGQEGLSMWKDRWYHEKLECPRGDLAARRNVVEAYVQGLHWVLEYYYRGVASWNWFYPYHYAPMASDCVGLGAVQVAFKRGQPFKPYEQLLSVLPAASCKLLPPAYHPLMLEPTSPILDFYPPDFDVDMEGKRADWEGVVKVPFIDEERLLAAMRTVSANALTQDEHKRNKLGSILVFQHCREAGGSGETDFCTSTLPHKIGDVRLCNSKCVQVPPPPSLPSDERGFQPRPTPGTGTGINAPPGQPTLMTMQVKPSLRKVAVNVLGMPSRKESLVLAVKDLAEALPGAKLEAGQLGQGLINSHCFVGYPYLQEALVVKVSDRSSYLASGPGGQAQVQAWRGQDAGNWQQQAGMASSNMLTKFGLDVGRVDILVHVKPFMGYVRHMDGSVQRQYREEEEVYPLQMILRRKPQPANAAASPSVGPDGLPAPPELAEGSAVLFLGKHHYGCLATVMPNTACAGAVASQLGYNQQGPTYRISVQPPASSAGEEAERTARRMVQQFTPRYLPSGRVAQALGVSPRLLGRITGNVWISDGDNKIDLGLCVKSGGKNLCVPGYSAPTPDGVGWMYSQALVQVLQEYKAKHPWLWTALEPKNDADDGRAPLRVDDLLPSLPAEERRAKVSQVQKWLKSQPIARRPLVKSTVKMVPDDGVRALVAAMPLATKAPAPVVYESVSPLLLMAPYKPGQGAVKMSVQGGEFDLGDRVVSVVDSARPPFGMRGTVIGVYDEACDVMFDEEFPGGSDLSGRLTTNNGFSLDKSFLVNLSKPPVAPLVVAPRVVQGQQAQRGAANAARPKANQQQERVSSAAPGGANQYQRVMSKNAAAAQQRQRPASAAPASAAAAAAAAAIARATGAAPAADTATAGPPLAVPAPTSSGAPPVPSAGLLAKAKHAALAAAAPKAAPVPVAAAAPAAAPAARPAQQVAAAAAQAAAVHAMAHAPQPPPAMPMPMHPRVPLYAPAPPQQMPFHCPAALPVSGHPRGQGPAAFYPAVPPAMGGHMGMPFPAYNAAPVGTFAVPMPPPPMGGGYAVPMMMPMGNQPMPAPMRPAGPAFAMPPPQAGAGGPAAPPIGASGAALLQKLKQGAGSKEQAKQ